VEISSNLGSRNAAYDDYITAIKNGEEALLLVDSESDIIVPVNDSSYDSDNLKAWKPWHHLMNRRGSTGELADSWEKPTGASDLDCHLMVQSMESWFLTDVEALKDYFGKRFREKSLPSREEVERIPKDTVLSSLNNASRDTQKGSYVKGAHSFEILARIDPEKVVSRSPWAMRFVTVLTERMRRAR